MGYQDVNHTKREKKRGEYKFTKLPENIRQIGEPPVKTRVYIEDYVMTYMHQVFQKKQENAIVVLVGKKGEKEAEDASFVYGAVEVELDILGGSHNFNSETWDKIYELIYEHFQGAEVMGWGCGVSIWNSQIDSIVRQIQAKHFAKAGRILFVEDLNEKEEKVFCWLEDKLKELPGYIIYYEKNPQMQDYMLLGQPKRSFEASYEDKVTATVRNVVHRNVEQGNPKKVAMYSAGIFLILLTILGANLLVQSTRKIASLEKTIETLSNAAWNVTENPQEKETKKNDKKNPDIQVTASPKSQKTPESGSKTEKKEEKLTPEPMKITATPKRVVTPSPVQTAKPVLKKSTPTPAATVEAAQTAKRTASSYVVRSGDTLSQIVWRQYHTLSCMEMVKKANKIKNSDEIKEGQILYLPAYQK